MAFVWIGFDRSCKLSIRKWMHLSISHIDVMQFPFKSMRSMAQKHTLFNGFWCNSNFFFSLSFFLIHICGCFVWFACDIFIEWINKLDVVHVQCLNVQWIYNTSVFLMPRTNPAILTNTEIYSLTLVCKQKELAKYRIESKLQFNVWGFPNSLHRCRCVYKMEQLLDETMERSEWISRFHFYFYFSLAF